MHIFPEIRVYINLRMNASSHSMHEFIYILRISGHIDFRNCVYVISYDLLYYYVNVFQAKMLSKSIELIENFIDILFFGVTHRGMYF